jgi:hypothetical protein
MSAPRSILTAACLLGLGLTWVAAGPHALEVVRAQGPFGNAPYDDPAALIGAPATRFYDPLGPLFGSPTHGRVKLVEPAYNIAADTNGLPTPNLLLTLGAGSDVIVRFDPPVTNCPANPHGIDLLVFGNAFYSAAGAVSDDADMNTLLLTGGVFAEQLKVSVSPGYTSQPGESPADPDTWPWHRYETGPYADTAFPTHAFRWDRATAAWTEDLMDFSKPVNPAMESVIRAGGLTAADALDLYDGSGGGTGLDLAESGFDWIRFVRVDGLDAGFAEGEIDAFAAALPRLIGDSLTVVPQGISTNPVSLFFQWSTLPGITQLRLDVTELDAMARIATTPVDDLTSLPTLPGVPLNVIELTASRLIGAGNLSVVTDLALSTGPGYAGDGSDLVVLRPGGGGWTELPFTFEPENSGVLVENVTAFSTFVLAQLAAPPLQISRNEESIHLIYPPVVGNLHVLEKSTNLWTWFPIHALTASNTTPVEVVETMEPTVRALYRLRMEAP